MKIFSFSLLYLFVLFACSEEQTPKVNSTITSEEKAATSTKRTVFFIDECTSAAYLALLERDVKKGKDSLVLTLQDKQQRVLNKQVLNVPADKTQINYCTEEYCVVGFSCGGPCYSQVFVFVDPKKKIEHFANAQRITNAQNLIAHIEKEDFDELIVHNFDNGKEITILNRDLNWTKYGQMDTLYMKNRNLIITYTTKEKKSKMKIFALDELYP